MLLIFSLLPLQAFQTFTAQLVAYLEQQLAALALSEYLSQVQQVFLDSVVYRRHSRYYHLREKVMKSVAAVIVRNIGT